MKVEHENRLRAIRRSDQRLRNRGGTSRVIARAKSALTTTAGELQAEAPGFEQRHQASPSRP